ncbi:MAG: carboxypeptidase regulatory-like domain-containing protein [Planctomycetes bacterium]|nr:carboxypeptidase regulatory-like domain-containing protein [Planctomycetota bacterium]
MSHAGVDASGLRRAPGRIVLTLDVPCQVVNPPSFALRRADGFVLRTRGRSPLVWPGLDPGRYTLALDDPCWPVHEREVVIEADASSTDVHFEAVPLDRVTGRVRAADGVPPASVSLRLDTDGDRTGQLFEPRLDASGRFDVGGWELPVDARRVRVVATAEASDPVASPWFDLADPHRFELAELDLVLRDRAVVRGRITDASADGAGLDAKVNLERVDPSGFERLRGRIPETAHGTTDADGRFELATRAPGDFVLTVLADPRTPLAWSDVLHLEPDERLDIDLDVPAHAALGGHVAGVSETLKGLTTLGLVSLGPARFVTTVELRDDLHFMFPALPPGRYRLEVHTPGVKHAEQIELRAGERTWHDVVVPPPSTLAGIVLGPPTLGRSVEVIDALGVSSGARPVDVDGNFTISVPFTGEIVCVVRGGWSGNTILAAGTLHVDEPCSVLPPSCIDTTRTVLTIVLDDGVLARLEAVPSESALAEALRHLDPPERLRAGEQTILGLPAGRYALAWQRDETDPVAETTFELQDDEPLRLCVPPL